MSDKCPHCGNNRDKIRVTMDDTWFAIGAIALVYIASYLGHIAKALNVMAHIGGAK
jgi:hypothetical protein